MKKNNLKKIKKRNKWRRPFLVMVTAAVLGTEVVSVVNPNVVHAASSIEKDDITGGWYEQDIRELAAKGIMLGEGNGIYAPNRAITRAEYANLISKSLNLPSGNATFKDLNNAHPTLHEGIKRTASAGIISGRGNGIFDPNAPITREESAIMTDKALQYKGIKGKEVNIPFKDQHQIYDKTFVQRLYSLGIVGGNNNNQFMPKSSTTRGESAAVINRMLHVLSGNGPGMISTVLLNIPFITQGNTMLCEGASLLQALHYKGVTKQTLTSFVNTMPKSTNNNPYNGYAGEWRYNVDGTYQGMMSAPLIQWAKNNGGNAVDITGTGISNVKNEVQKGNPVVTWITYNYATPQFKKMSWGNAVWNGHVVTVDGYKPGYIHVVDPVFGSKWINETTFTNAFNTTGMAVSVS